MDWVAASLRLFQEFANHGGQRAVFAGTCAEYDWQPPTPVSGVLRRPGSIGANDPALRSTSEPASGDLQLNELTSPSNPSTLYGVCKNSLRLIIESYAKQLSIPVAWGRIFFLYGPDENPGRLVPSILQPLLKDQPAVVRSGGHVRNLMHVEDVARAFAAILNSDVTGIVNVADPHAVSLGDVAKMLGELTGKSDLVKVEQAPGTPQNPRFLTADVARLSSIGFAPKYSLREGLSTLLSTKESG
jgi:dTDP-L-rhamnose 4-epimerase